MTLVLRKLSIILALVCLVILASCSTPQDQSGLITEPPRASPSPAPSLQTTPTIAPTRTKTPLPPTATAPGPYSVITDIEQVLGTWKFSDADFTRFYPDDTYHDAYSLTELDNAPYAVNRIEFKDGYVLAREVSVSGVPPCGGTVGVYELRLLQSGKLQIVVIKDLCGPRAGDTQGLYEPIH